MELGYYESSTDAEYIQYFEDCLLNLPRSRVDVFGTIQKNEKVFLPMRPEYGPKNCYWVTMSVGEDSSPEKMFKEKYPDCTVFGIEISPNRHDEFRKYGQVVNSGVEVEEESYMLAAYKNDNLSKTTTVLPLRELLDAYVGERLIHYMNIDMYGFEYSIMNQLLPEKKLAKQGITFCQIDSKLHNARLDSSQSIKEFIQQFAVLGSNYLPIYYAEVPDLYHKITFINIDNEECQEVFDMTKYLT